MWNTSVFLVLSLLATVYGENLLHDVVVRSDFHGKIYHFGTVARVNWFRANNYCRLNGMQLVNVPTNDENNFLESQIMEVGYFTESFWFSGTDLAENGSFVWGNGRPFVFSNFVANSGNSGNCVVASQSTPTSRYMWDVRDCNSEQFFICERTIDDDCRPSTPPTTPNMTDPTTTVMPPTVPPPIFGVVYELMTSESMNWMDARGTCVSLGWRLAAVIETFEDERLKDLMVENGFNTTLNYFWTSLNDLNNEGVFTWYYLGGDIYYNHWGQGFPRNGTNERCAGLGYTVADNDIVWQNRNCDTEHFFVCEHY